MLVPRAGAQAVGWEAQSRESTAGPTRLPLTATSSFGTGRCAELQVHVTEVMATAAEQRDLIARLEQDLSTIQSIQRPDAEVSPPPTPPPHHLPRALSASLDTARSSGSWCPPDPPPAPQGPSPTASGFRLLTSSQRPNSGCPATGHRARSPLRPGTGLDLCPGSSGRSKAGIIHPSHS